ncbi:insecticidal delta-endotoxin Cry8Ea1 family protein [Streptomyces sp. Ac-502]|uniref:insecticidal delta-endotoxin Cry8Ea1 family protein n=1 Tax=Streptomyces sp. Ac-502 TaxID=3342801 RepID=UPI0038626FA1
MDEEEHDTSGVNGATGAPVVPEVRKDASQLAIDGVKVVIPGLLKLVPGIGTVAGMAMKAALDLLFPAPDVWSQLRDKIKQFVREEINQAYFEELREDLKGIRDIAGDYSDLAQLGQDHAAIQSKWLATESAIAKAVPRFDPTGAPGDVLNPVPLLPLFVQVVNLHLLLLRDMALYGHQWGFHPTTVDRYKEKLAGLAGPDSASSYMRRARKTYERGYGQCGSDVERMSYERGMVMNGYAQHTAWEYFDAVKYPKGHDVNLDWVVYVGPFGRITGGMPAAVRPHPGGATSVRDLTVYTGRRVYGARWQPWASGPDGPALTVGKTDAGKAHPVESGDRSIRHLWGYGWPASVEFGVLGLAFGVGTTQDDKEKAPPGWIGEPSLDVINPRTGWNSSLPATSCPTFAAEITASGASGRTASSGWRSGSVRGPCPTGRRRPRSRGRDTCCSPYTTAATSYRSPTGGVRPSGWPATSTPCRPTGSSTNSGACRPSGGTCRWPPHAPCAWISLVRRSPWCGRKTIRMPFSAKKRRDA